jgi:hypothetical protein
MVAHGPSGPPTIEALRSRPKILVDFVRKSSTIVLEMRTSRTTPQQLVPVSPALKALVG